MPLVKRVHGRRDSRSLWTEMVFPSTAYKKRQAISPLRNELMQIDLAFREDVAKIRRGLNLGRLSPRKADNLYFEALDAAIRRRRARTG